MLITNLLISSLVNFCQLQLPTSFTDYVVVVNGLFSGSVYIATCVNNIQLLRLILKSSTSIVYVHY